MGSLHGDKARSGYFLVATATRKQFRGTQGAEYGRKSDRKFHLNFHSKLAADQELPSCFAVTYYIS